VSIEVELTRGKVAIVDDIDYDSLKPFSWCAAKIGHTWYARRGLWTGETILMHREIARFAGIESPCIDHINRNGLDNRRCNLRPATQSQNIANGGMWKNNTSGYRGVCLIANGKWRAATKHKGKYKQIGEFDTPEEAAKAYNAYCSELFGSFAFQNTLKEPLA
jgi:hypothetical protein